MLPPTSPTEPSPFFSEQLAARTASLAADADPLESPFTGADALLRRDLDAAVAELAPSLRDLAVALHGDPETAFEEKRAAQRLADLIAADGLDAQVGVFGRETGVAAEFTAGTGGRTVAVLAEYDALPDLGHACGHNIIAATGVGAFLALHRLTQRHPDAFCGRVRFLGTPGEEGHSGKEYMAREGAFDGVDAALMLHPYGYDAADQVWLGRRTLTITFTGRAAHASSEPFMGRNALDAATLFYTGIGLLRQQMIPVDRVHAVISEGGTRASIIPERAVVQAYVRSKYPQTLVDLSQRVGRPRPRRGADGGRWRGGGVGPAPRVTAGAHERPADTALGARSGRARPPGAAARCGFRDHRRVHRLRERERPGSGHPPTAADRP